MFPPMVPLIGHEGIPPLLEAMSSQYLHQLHQGLWELSLLRAWCQEYGGPAYSYWGETCLNDDNEYISNKQCISTYWSSGRSRRCLCMLHSWQWLDGSETYWRSKWTMQGNWTLRRTSHCLRGPQALNHSCRWPSFGIGKVCCVHGHGKHQQDNNGCFLVLFGQADYCTV